MRKRGLAFSGSKKGLLVVLTHPEIWSWFSATVCLSSEKGEDFKQQGQEIPGDLVQYPERERERERERQLIQNKRKLLSCLHSLPAGTWLYFIACFLSADKLGKRKRKGKKKTESTWFLETYSLSSNGQRRKVRLPSSCLMAFFAWDTTHLFCRHNSCQ